MSISVDARRLAATVFASLLAHLCLLAMISKGLPGIGRPDALNFQAKNSLLVTINTHTALQDAGLARGGEYQITGLDNYQGLKELDAVGVLEVKPERQGLPTPIDVFDGPPYPPPDPTYWPAAMLEQPPRPIDDMDTRFPELENREVAGRMVFSLLIDELGHVDEVLIEYSSLEKSVVENAQSKLLKMNFQAGRKNGLNVKSRTRIEVNFSYSVL